MSPPKSKGTGKKKIEMRKIEKKSSRQVCFSKRRQGLFKKASELSILCGVDIAVLAFSPAGRFYSYAHPDLDFVVDRFLGSSDWKENICTRAANGFWWENANMLEMKEEHRLQHLLKSLKEVKGKVESRIKELTCSAEASCLPPLPLQYDSHMNAESVICMKEDGLMMPPVSNEEDDDGLIMQFFAQDDELVMPILSEEEYDDGSMMPIFHEEKYDELMMQFFTQDDGQMMPIFKKKQHNDGSMIQFFAEDIGRVTPISSEGEHDARSMMQFLAQDDGPMMPTFGERRIWTNNAYFQNEVEYSDGLMVQYFPQDDGLVMPVSTEELDDVLTMPNEIFPPLEDNGNYL